MGRIQPCCHVHAPNENSNHKRRVVNEAPAQRPLPPAVEAAYQLLNEHGPTTPGELAERLLNSGFRQGPERLLALPDRFPNRFTIDGDGRLCVARASSPLEEDSSADEDSAIWLRRSSIHRVPHERVAVIDIETTGLDRHTDFVWEIGIVDLLGDVHLDLRIQTPPDRPAPVPPRLDEVSLADAFDQLATCLEDFDVVAGQNSIAFDLPFLDVAADRLGATRPKWPAVVDLIDLSVVCDVSLPSRRLDELARLHDVSNPAPHRALADATTTASVIRGYLSSIDAADPNWKVAISILESGDHPLVHLLPEIDELAGLEALELPANELLGRPAAEYADAFSAMRQGFDALAAAPGFRRRTSQREMATAVAQTLDHGDRLAVEAPTGTGKSLAYLLPAIGRAAGSGKPVVIATATKALQQQLRADAARLAADGLLGTPYRQIQGVSNYVCAREIDDGLRDPEASSLALAVAARTLTTSTNGTWDDVTDDVVRRRDSNYARTRGQLRTTAAGCDRRSCAWASTCPLMQQLAGIEDAPGVVSVSHALVASWVRLSRLGFSAPGDVLSDGRADLIFDEAHTLEDTLTAAWTDRVDGLELELLARAADRRSRFLKHLRRFQLPPELKERRSEFAAVGAELRAVGDIVGRAVVDYLHEYAGRSDATVLVSGLVQGRPEFRTLRQALGDARTALIAYRRSVTALTEGLASIDGTSSLRRRLWSLSQRAETAIELLEHARLLPDSHLWVHRLSAEDEEPTAWVYERIPIHVFPDFVDTVVERAHSVTLCSATLTVERQFDFLASRLGIDIDPDGGDGRFRGLLLDSPFNYAEQSKVILTNHLPVPVPSNEREFCEDLAADQVGFLSLSGGRALTLFAARTRMELVAGLVRAKEQALAERGVEVLVQGELGRSQILQRFRNELGTVLYGLRSYWEGFDAPGETLSFLFIEKPPYPHPDDPLIAARQRAVAERGGDPFVDYVLPLTAMLFTQGFGRLVRSEDDRGVALICDRRLHTPGIARRVLLESLPGPTVHEALDRNDAWITALEFVDGTAPDLANALTLPVDDVSAMLESLRLIDGEAPDDKLAAAAFALFGIEQLHPAQLELMKAALDGRDVLGVLPTGFGKSLCFQLPALLHPIDRATLVVSPLIALIKDQVNELRGRRGIRSVQGITGMTSKVIQTEILRDVADGRIRLLYVSPERFARDPVLRGALSRLELNGVVVDEAHCVSVWGHDFRPEFRQIPAAVAEFTARAPRAGFTATATIEVADDIELSLDLDDPVVVREPVDRPNLTFRVQQCADERTRARELLRFVTWIDDQPGIVYVTRRALAEEIASLLRRAGIRARHYHAGMVPEQRDAVQEDFDADVTQIIVATKAFGMGINKPNIGWVVHYDLPDSLDGYAQEAGRAARRREINGNCLLLFTKADLARRRKIAAGRRQDRDEQTSQRVLDAMWVSPMRRGDHVFEADEIAEQLQIDDDELNVQLARLESVGVLKRGLDCSARGTVAVGQREPELEADRRLFRELFYQVLHTRPHVRTMIDFADLDARHGYDPDDLEARLIEWSLDRLVTFSSSRRLRRVTLLERKAPIQAIARETARWAAWQQRRVSAVIDYALNARTCRRAQISEHFGDPAQTCNDRHVSQCDVCSTTMAPWISLDDHLVPDPELLVNAELSVLQAVAWASSFQKGSYGEVGLRAAVLGQETLANGVPLGPGLQNCPQFGALRHVRNGAKRWDAAVVALLDASMIERREVDAKGRHYNTLALTNLGARSLGIKVS